MKYTSPFLVTNLTVILFHSYRTKLHQHWHHHHLVQMMASSSSSSSSTTTKTVSFSSCSSTEPSSASLSIKQAKKKLRSEIDAKLGRLNGNEVERQSEQVHNKLFALTEFRKATRVGLYLSLPLVEIDTIRILEHCFANGKQCFVPKYHPKSRKMDFVQVNSMEDYESLPYEPKWKIKQPDPIEDKRAEALSTGGLDVLLVPGVAFTPEGLRCGHGMGYFDTWLARCAATKSIQHPITIGLALTEQIVDDLPVTDWDIRIDRIIAP
ncbi:hypothetical protein RDWZM_003409 [Blomia tropicalis]|uniref:5-formyltetrahydrofolate cyclo-ligase n=1 Tax=Blomia tropicalis TaxID=40697 RepID=A0A9Q0MFH5_BLOTA|nr:hypothetical protein RDWZM_003409 [Blomia tropicalis]